MKSISRFVLSASVVLALTGCHTAYDTGLEKLASGEYQAAAKVAEEGLKERPNDPELNLLMAEALVGENQFAPAEPYARKAFREPTLRAPAGRTLGKILWELGQPVGAVDVWRDARAAEPGAVSDEDFVRGLEIAITTAVGIQEFQKAFEMRQELAVLAPNHPEVTADAMRRNREDIASEHVRAGELKLAVEAYAALFQDFKDAKYEFERGRAFMVLNQEDDATRAFESYIELAASNDRAERAVAVAERADKSGKPALAIAFYDRALAEMGTETSNRRAFVHLTLAGLLLGSRATDQGRIQLNAYLEQMKQLHGAPVDAEHYVTAANVATQNRAPEIAIELLEVGIVDATPSWRTARLIAELYARRSRNADVERVLKIYVERAENTSTAQVNVGRWAASRRNFELAVFFLEAAVAQKEISPGLWLEIARVYAGAGRLDDMRRALDAYLKLSNNSMSSLADVASIYRSQRIYDQAEATLLKAFKAAPTEFTIVQDLESLYRESGRNAKMHEVYEKYIKARGGQAEDYAMVAGRFMRQNEWDDALPYLQQAAAKGDVNAWLQISDVYKRQRKERDMKAALSKYLALAANREAALEEVWQRYRTSQWNHEAIPVLEELTALQPQNVVFYEELSELYFQQGRDVDAFELWKKYIDKSRDPVLALESMARRFERRGHDEWMLSLLEKMTEREGNTRPELYRLLGDAHYAAAQRRGRLQLNQDENVIFSADDRARTYYKTYLGQAQPTSRELRAFADSLRLKRLWDVAALAYEKLGVHQSDSADELLSYGTVLLNLGRPQDAIVVLNKFYDLKGKSLDAARQAVDVLAPAKQFPAMEPFLIRMLEAGDENQLRNAFMQLAEVYRQTDRPQEIGTLINTYLAKSQNPTEARRTALVVIESTGLWEEGVKQLERIADTEGEESRFELGRMLYRVGRLDDAEQAFRQYAGGSVAQGEAWWRVASFYEGHADVRNAEDAFNAAVAAAPQNDTLLMERARFRVLTGRVEDGQKDFESARSMVDHARKGGIWRVEVEALVQIGDFARARQASREALKIAFLDRDYFARIAAAVELSSGDNARAQRFVDELKTGGLPVEILVELLVQHRHLETAASVMEAEIREGDYTLGGDLALTYADVFTTLGGMDRFLRTLQPLFERGRDGRILGRVGEFMAREGRYDQAALYLRAAVDQGTTQHRPTLVQVYLNLGHEDEAVRQLQALLLETPEGGQGLILSNQAPTFEVLGMQGALYSLVEQLAADPRFRAYAAPMLVHMLAEKGDVNAAMNLILSSWSRLRPTETGMPAGDVNVLQMADVSVGMLRALAAEGFLAESAAMIEVMPVQLRNQDSVRDFGLRLAALRAEDGSAQVDQALAALGEATADQLKRLKIAQLLAYSGDVDKAQAIAEPLLTSGDPTVARNALRTLLASGRIRHDLSKNKKWVDQFVASSQDKAGARATAAEIASVLADDTLLVELANKTLSLVPTDSNIRVAIHNAQVSGDLKLFQKASAAYWRVAAEPVSEVSSYIETFTERHDPDFVDALIGNYVDAFPDNWLGRWAIIKLHFKQGDVEKAREEILVYLDQVAWDAQAVQETLGRLAEWRLWGEMARFVGPRIPQEAMTAPVLRELGRANIYLGFKDTGVSALDQYVAASADPASAAAELALELMLNQHPQTALRYADLAVQKRPGRSHGYLVRGMARVALGEDADDDIQRGINDGAGRIVALHRLGYLALSAGRPDLAEKYLAELIRMPRINNGFGYVAFALDAYDWADKDDEGVKFLEKHWPELAAGIGFGAQEVVPALASLYEGAGLVERVFSLYEEGIRSEFVSAPFTGNLPTYRNNLAYVYSTSNKNIDEGMGLIGLAMGGDSRRNASFIDTLGWLHYRQGDVEKAHQEIERALRSSSGSAAELVELYEHLAELEHLRGNTRKAAWLRIFAGLINER